MLDLSQAKSLLQAVFPDPRVKIAEDFVGLVVSAMPEDAQKSLVGEVLAPFVPSGYPLGGQDDLVVDYWKVTAVHERMNGSKHVPLHRFHGVVPMVRVFLPESKRDVSTKIGIVYAGDHLQWTHKMADNRMKHGLRILSEKLKPSRPDYAAACARAASTRVDYIQLTTPARFYGARFAAVAVEVHVGEDGSPVAYRLEAGMATGEPMIDFVSPAGESIEPRMAWYEPTPFSVDTQRYSGNLVLEGIDPTALRVFKQMDAYSPIAVRINTVFEKAEPDTVWPSLLTAQAALRVAAIARRMGRPIPGLPDLIRDALAEIAINTLDWEVKP